MTNLTTATMAKATMTMARNLCRVVLSGKYGASLREMSLRNSHNVTAVPVRNQVNGSRLVCLWGGWLNRRTGLFPGAKTTGDMRDRLQAHVLRGFCGQC